MPTIGPSPYSQCSQRSGAPAEPHGVTAKSPGRETSGRSSLRTAGPEMRDKLASKTVGDSGGLRVKVFFCIIQ